MSKGTEMLATIRNDSLNKLYRAILKYEKEHVLSDDSIIRSLIEEHYDSNPAYFMMNYLAFSRDVLFEIAKRHYGDNDFNTIKNRVITISYDILHYNVEYWFDNDDKYLDGICLSDSDEKNIKSMIKLGFREGVLRSDGEKGYWIIK